MGRRLLAAVLVVSAAWPWPALGANRGIEVSPPLANIVISGGAETPFAVSVKNHSDAAITLYLSAVDFKSLNETGGAAFLDTRDPAAKYGLSGWMRLDQKSLDLPAGQSAKVTGAIINREDLAPGGHYGAVLFSLNPPLEGRTQIGLRQVASSLIFALKTGGEKYGLRLDSLPGLPRWALGPPAKVRLRFQNTGNVHTAPRGLVTITDPAGRIVSKGTINVDSSLVLPDSYRQLAVGMQRIRPAAAIGNYQVLVQYRPDNSDKIATYSQKIFILSLLGLLQIAFILAVAGLLARLGWLIYKRPSSS